MKNKQKRKLYVHTSRSRFTKKSKFNNLSNSIPSITVAWLDPKNNDYLNRKARLRSIGNYLQKFNDTNSCINYLLSIKNNLRKLFLVLPGSSGRKIVPLINDQTNILFIYIFCEDREKHEGWIKSYSNKIRGVFIDKHELLTKLNEDVDFYTKTIPILMIPEKVKKEEKSVHDLSKEEASFIWYGLLIEILNRMPLTSVSRKDLLNECRKEYQEDPIELRKIQEFEETYNTDNVIEWYTRDAFLYRLLNRALSTRDISIIFRFRFVLVDLHHRLTYLHNKYIQSLDDTKSLTVYRGQGLKIDELNDLKNNINGRIAMNSFISASLSSEVALDFAGNGTGRPLFESVLFLIESIFQIESVEQLTDKIWLVTLILCEDEINSIKDELIDSLKSEIDETADVLTLAKFLLEMDDLDKAEEFYTLLLNELPTDHPDVITIKNDLGGVYREKGQYLQALETHQQALNLHRLLMPSDFVQRAAIFNDIGYVYFELGDYCQSLKYHQKTLRIRRKHQPFYKNHLAITYKHLGSVYNEIGKKKIALRCHRKALAIERQHYPEADPHLGSTYNNIGEVYLSMQNIKKARIYLEKGLDIRLKSLPSNHRSLAVSYSNLAQFYDYNNEHEKALEYHQKSLDILLNCLPSNHIEIATIYNNIGECFSDLGDFTSALIHHKKALKIRYNLLSTSRAQAEIVISYCNIGVLFSDQNKYKLALKYFRKGLILASTSPGKSKLLAMVYYDIATVYHNKSKINLAMKYYNKALKFEYKANKSNSSLDVAKIYFGLGQMYDKKDDYTTALIQFEKSLEIRRRCLTSDHSLIEETLSTTAFIYSKQGDNDKALEYFKEALDLQMKSESIYLASTCISIGSIYHAKGDHQTALIYYQNALKYAANDNPELGSLYYQIGLIYDDKKDLDMALENYLNALKYPSKIDSIIDDVYERAGSIYHTKRYYSQALINHKKALTICKNRKSDATVIYYHIASVYDDKAEHTKAIKFYKKALKEYREQKLSRTNLLSKIYNNMAGIYIQSNKSKLALNYYRKSLKLTLHSSMFSADYADLAIVYNNIGTARSIL
ncbi:unnamed protein product, partial [Rotaria sp. Silwood1]